MTWWPGWDSIADSGWWSQFWFWIGVVSLVLFGASQLASRLYGSREAELLAAAPASRPVPWASPSEPRVQPTPAAQPVRQEAQPPPQPQDRHVSGPQRQVLAEHFKSLNGVRISLVLLEDREAANFGEDLLSALQDAGVVVAGLSRRNVLLPAPVGLRVWYKEGDPGSAALLAAFDQAQIAATPMPGRLSDLSAHVVVGVQRGLPAGPRAER